MVGSRWWRGRGMVPGAPAASGAGAPTSPRRSGTVIRASALPQRWGGDVSAPARAGEQRWHRENPSSFAGEGLFVLRRPAAKERWRMAEFEYQKVEAWHTAVKLAASVGRLKTGSSRKAPADAQAHAYEQAGLAAGLIAEATGREGGAQVGLLRDARGALAQCRSWLHVLGAVTHEQDSVFGNDLDLAEQAARQVGGMLRTLDRPAPGGPRPRPRPPLPARAPAAPR